MVDLGSCLASVPELNRGKVLEALKILADAEIFTRLARMNANQLVENRIDSSEEGDLVREIREVRQTNRVLLVLEESARELTKGMDNA